MLDVLSLGAGVQSTALLYLSCDGLLPRLDAAIFADTMAEPKAVYAHLERCKEKAAKHSVRLIVASAGDLRADLLEFWRQRKSADGKRHASIPAFVKNPGTKEEFMSLWGLEIQYGDESRGLVRRQCTSTYKIEVVEKGVRDLLGLKRGQRWPVPMVNVTVLETGKVTTWARHVLKESDWADDGLAIEAIPFTPSVRQWIGISADEASRRSTSRRPAIVLHYPLLDVLEKPGGLFPRGWTRQDCLDWLHKAGYPEPPRSACTFCPFRSDAEWARMKAEAPADFADACEVDRLIRSGERSYQDKRGEPRGEPYLHSSLIPLEMVQFKPAADKSEGRGMVNECEGMCGV